MPLPRTATFGKKLRPAARRLERLEYLQPVRRPRVATTRPRTDEETCPSFWDAPILAPRERRPPGWNSDYCPSGRPDVSSTAFFESCTMEFARKNAGSTDAAATAFSNGGD